MKPLKVRIAPYTLILSVIGLLGIAFFTYTDKNFGLYSQISLGLVLLGGCLYTFLDPQKIRRIFNGRQVKYASNTFMLSIAFLGIIVIINYLVYDHPLQWDVTQDQVNSLSKETLQILNAVGGKISARAFYSGRMSSENARKLLENFKNQSQGKLEYEFIDPEINVLEATQAGITKDGTIVLSMNGQNEIVPYATEQEMAKALFRLNNPGERVLYFLTGHGETLFDEKEGDLSITSFANALTAKNYQLKNLYLAEEDVPKNALAILLVRPEIPLSKSDFTKLEKYLSGGGSLVYFSESPLFTNFKGKDDPLGDYLHEDLSIIQDEDLIIDPNSTQIDANSQPIIAIADPRAYANHPITNHLSSVPPVFPSARSISPGSPKLGVKLSTLVITGPDAWGETDIRPEGQISFENGTDKAGPLSLAISTENETTHARVVVIGDADFISDNAFESYGNSDFALNVIDWAAEQEDLISLTPQKETNRILISPDKYTLALLFFGSIFLLPLLTIALGVTTWIERKKKG